MSLRGGGDMRLRTLGWELQQKRGERLTPWEQALDSGYDEEAGPAHGVEPGPDCFSCASAGPPFLGFPCRLIGRLASGELVPVFDGKRIALIDAVTRLLEYRGSTDPHDLCPGHTLAPDPELAQRRATRPRSPRR